MLKISMNSQTFVEVGKVQVVMPPTVAKLSPVVGPIQGGTFVDVFGENFFDTVDLRCRFGHIFVKAYFVNENHLKCETPAVSEPQSVDVDVFVQDVISSLLTPLSTARFDYTASIFVNKVVPMVAFGSYVHVLTIFGSDALRHVTHCSFGDFANNSVATVANDSLSIQCDLTVFSDVFEGINESILIPISLLADDFSTTAGFSVSLFKQSMAVEQISPNIISSGLPRLIVTGFNFRPNIELSCFISHGANLVTEVPVVRFVSSTELWCESGEYDNVSLFPGPAVVTVDIAGRKRTYNLGDGKMIKVHSLAQLDSLEPLSGTIHGGTKVIINGVQLPIAEAPVCFFDLIAIPAIIFEDRVECIAPKHQNGVVEVQVSVNNGHEMIPIHNGERLQFKYVVAPEIVAVDSIILPDYLSEVDVELTVRGLESGTELRCFVGDSEVGISPIEEYESNLNIFKCKLNLSNMVSGHSISLTSNGQDFITWVESLTFWPRPTISEIVPKRITTIGGTSLKIALDNVPPLNDNDDFVCFVGGIKVIGYKKGNEIMCFAPEHKPGFATVQVQIGQFSTLNSYVEYVEVPIINSISPMSGSVIGDYWITITGSNFVEEMECYIGEMTLSMMFISEHLVKCLVNEVATAKENLAVKLAINSVDFSVAVDTFNYFIEPWVSNLTPMRGTPAGGSEIIVEVSSLESLDFSNTLFCCFDGVVATSSKIDSAKSSVICKLPSSLGRKSLEIGVSVDGIRCGNRTLPFYYLDSDFEVSDVVPAFIPTGGNIELSVTGRNFVNAPNLQCIFDESVVVVALWVSSSEIRCIAPSHLPAVVPVEVGLNNAFSTNSGKLVEYVEDPIVVGIYPSHGPPQGGTIVTVSGRGFTSKSSYVCHFGSFPAVTHFISSTEIQCEAPQLLHGMGRMFIVSVSNNGVNFTDNTDVWFSYDLPLHVSTISPSKGSILGGTEVLLLGSNFHFYAGAYSRSEILCKFGTSGVEVSAMLLDDETLSCVSPSSESTESSTVDLFVALNGVDFLPIGHEFHFYSNFKLIRLSPNRGSPLLSNRFDSNAEGTPILVHGSGFVESEDLLCKVGQQISKARFITSAVVECVVAVVHLSEQEQSRDLFVAISNNGIDFADALVFTVDLPPMVFSITPNSGLFRGQIPSFVTGDNFQNSTDLACRFGQQDVPALYLSSQQVVCVVPSRVGNQIEPFGSIDVEITNNGIDYSASGVEFEYISECPEGHYCSRWEIFAAPNGTYAEGSGNVNFTMCEPGAFQPKTQQTSCLRCPIGFYCPDFGMAAPRICKAGFVCDILGLRTPVTPCPPGHYCLEGTKTSNPGDLKASGEWVEDPDTLMLTFVPSSRTWAFVDRVLPETGQSRAEHPPSTENLPLKGERPFPCPIGYYCLPGVATPNPQVKNFSTPQKCFNGFYCPIGSTTPEGDGPCTTGHYCPDDVTSIPCPIGHFCPKVGNIRALECRPGTYNPLTMQSKCVLCPPGHICPGWGRTEPDICPAGFVCMEPGE
eukprot:TRINITY_DN2955_c0_g4_i10.p1 TRINITY_DN2955_c0_g4~~TRINITY_DN2955_c0_g4_i10.p1  ORF type:complete len:1670 (+),score=351.95 TRINITY_DN2955_c0_g4_i10:496-5010(+)